MTWNLGVAAAKEVGLGLARSYQSEKKGKRESNEVVHS
jgi:hypothetical protein